MEKHYALGQKNPKTSKFYFVICKLLKLRGVGAASVQGNIILGMILHSPRHTETVVEVCGSNTFLIFKQNSIVGACCCSDILSQSNVSSLIISHKFSFVAFVTPELQHSVDPCLGQPTSTTNCSFPRTARCQNNNINF